MSESFSSEPEAKDVERGGGDFEMVQEGAMFPWDEKAPGCTCCGCLSYVLQIILMAACCGSFLFGINLSLLNTSLGTIGLEYKWCGNEFDKGCTTFENYGAFISTSVLIGAAAGSMTSGSFLFMGRRIVLLLSMTIFAFGIVTSCVSNSFVALLWARLVVGYGVGVVSFVCPMYIAEMSPADRRGTYGVFHQLFITVGIFVGVLLGLPFSAPPSAEDVCKDNLPEGGDPADCDGVDKYPAGYNWKLSTFDKVWWRVMLGLGIIPTAIAAYLLSKTYRFETPHYYVEHRRLKDAEALLKKLHNKDDVMEEVREIDVAFKEGEKAKAEGLTCGAAMKDSSYRYVIIVGMLLSAFQQFSGINVFIVSSNSLFEEAGLSGTMVTVMSTVMTLVNTLMTFPALYLIEKMGRKSLLLMGTIGQTVGVLPAAIMYWVDKDGDVTMWLAIIGAIIFIVFFAVAYGPVLWVFLFEIYPPEIKGTAAGLATMINWIAGIIMVFVTQYLNNQISYTLFAVLNAVSIAIVALMMKETKGRSIDDSPYFPKK